MILFLFIGCERGGSDPNEITDPNGTDQNEYVLKIEDGNFQAGIVGKKLLDDLKIRVEYSDGVPVEGMLVRFLKLGGEGEGQADYFLSNDEALTDSEGIAFCRVTAKYKSGMGRIRAQLSDMRARPVTFHLSIYPEPTAAKKPICFLSVNDFHSHMESWGPKDDLQGGIARIAWLFKKIRQNNDKVGVQTVIMDGGDDFENTLYHDIPGFLSWLIATWDKSGVDVWQVGNHDFHFGIPFLHEQVMGAKKDFTDGEKGHPMRITFGNVDPSTIRDDLVQYIPFFETEFSDSEGNKLYEQTATFKAGDITIGVFGAATIQAVYTQVPGDPKTMKLLGAENPYSEGVTFIDPVPGESDYVERAIDQLVAEGADIIVFVSHVGLGFGDRVNLPPGFDDVIAKNGVGRNSGRAIDLVISAHSHVQLNHPISVQNPAGGKTHIVQAREGGLFVARLDAVTDLYEGGLQMIDSRLIQVNSDLEEDSMVVTEVEDWKKKASEFYPEWADRDLVENPVWMSHRAGTISGLGNLINEAFMWKLDRVGQPVQTSLVVPSLYRSDIWPGILTASQAYDVLSLHKMDEVGTNPDTVSILTLHPGKVDASLLFLPGTWHYDTTVLEYALEFIHTLADLQEMIPMMAKELNVDVLQVAGLSYEADLTAPPFHHVVPGSVRVDGEKVDPNKTYRMAVVETFASSLSKAMNTLIVARQKGEGFVKIFQDDPETGMSYIDTQIPIWQALQDYLEWLPSGEVSQDLMTVKGEVLVTEQPDLMVNPTELEVVNAKRGETATFTMRIRNLGRQPVNSARVRLFVDVTPWDTTDQDDGNSVLEGLSSTYMGSLSEVGNQTFSVNGYPDYAYLTFDWEVPRNLPPGSYTAHVRCDQIVGSNIDFNTGERYTDLVPDNDSGEQIMKYFSIE